MNTYDHAALQKRAVRFLWAYEIAVIIACIGGGLYIATSQGGSLLMAAPLALVACAEMLRIPVAALATRLSWTGRLLSTGVLLVIAVVSFEGLALLFENFLDNRTGSVLAAQRVVDKAQERLDAKSKIVGDAQSSLDVAREKVARLDADIQNKERAAPTNPGFSGKTCTGSNGRAVTCSADRQARTDFTAAQRNHIATLADLRARRSDAQKELDVAAASVSQVSHVEAEQSALVDAKGSLSDVMHLSPMHRLAASVLGVRVADLKEEQFESVKRIGVVGLAGAFATLSMFVSVVVHQTEHDGSESKLSRAIRGYLARRRKRIVSIREVPGPERVVEVEREVVREIPVRQTIIKHVPVDYRNGRYLRLPEKEIAADRLNPIVSKLVGEA
jgi:hypothetical protein